MSKPIHLLRRGECRFAVTPHSAPSHLFCAEPVEKEGAVYCAHHAEICFDRRSAEQRQADAERAAIARDGHHGGGPFRRTVVSRLCPPTEPLVADEAAA